MAPRVPQPAPPSASAPRPDESSKTRYGEAAALPRGRVTGVLIATEGDLEGEVYRVFDGENKCGRSKHCQVHLPSEWISREHAILIHQDGVFAIRPLKDENPVVVNGERTEGAALQDGDVLRLGRTTFRFRSAG
jgi:pSer/pThr/pTyr-binding forkhead associated (FHA) protein